MPRCLLSFLLVLLTAGIPAQGQHIRKSISGASFFQPGHKRPQNKPCKRHMSPEDLRKAAIKAGPMRPEFDQSHRRNFPDPKKYGNRPSPGAYPWHFDITYMMRTFCHNKEYGQNMLS